MIYYNPLKTKTKTNYIYIYRKESNVDNCLIAQGYHLRNWINILHIFTFFMFIKKKLEKQDKIKQISK